LSGDEKAAPEIRKRAGSRWRYVLWSKRKVKAHRLRQNQDARIGSKGLSMPGEALKVHARRSAARAASWGEIQARCGKPEAIGGVLRLRRASFTTERRVDRNG
jgi:hypothetical protein